MLATVNFHLSNEENQIMLDSDVSLKSNVIECLFENFKGYATGKLIMVDSSGHEIWQKKALEMGVHFTINYKKNSHFSKKGILSFIQDFINTFVFKIFHLFLSNEQTFSGNNNF